MNKLLISGAVATFGFIGKLFIDSKKKQEAEYSRLLSKIITSSSHSIKGYKVIKHIRMVSIADETDKSVAERKFLLAIEEAGGNGVINMQIRPHRGGYFSVQGDAVLIEPVSNSDV